MTWLVYFSQPLQHSTPRAGTQAQYKKPPWHRWFMPGGFKRYAKQLFCLPIKESFLGLLRQTHAQIAVFFDQAIKVVVVVSHLGLQGAGYRLRTRLGKIHSHYPFAGPHEDLGHLAVSISRLRVIGFLKTIGGKGKEDPTRNQIIRI